ncbi:MULTISPECIES: flagellar basal body P-ring formation chaperone FlgA [Shewanella]|uniref:flagellar basal body P-ring formation chaperone FlgA n=1 Tax=Shewanella TaxID=22 RepID=UPI00005E0C5B|nr:MULTISPECIES: flagellar basal body P-ring formation chaperone FlgA [Shewanella]VEE63466.1 flagellar basal body P-ring biosynthesis protein FlgA [Shewanella putrefaciens]ABK47552.1 flagellar basal-body P-ring formation protein FlgA, putative [Shewanella sp. ANA-3]MCL1120099.1 flagellar basal body P-ring formation protein FlgA [Shewanella seohaensis]MCT8875083.1 flagellar basal body P-ring formation protein FlgA [Shewanella xiamenensis]MDH0447869.1 flagellar basal body P-ring formation chaper
MKVNLVYFLCVIALFLTSAANAAPEVPSVSAISELAKALINEKISVPANAKVEIAPQPIDNRLLPAQCASPIKVELASDREISRNNTVKVSCDTPDLAYPWQIFMSVRVDILFPVVVASETLAPGELISPTQVEIRYIDQNSLRGMQFSDTSQLSGVRVKRRVAKNFPIFANNLCFVCKNDSVSIYVRSSNFVLKTVGEALQDGNIGDQIRVKNSSSNKELDAIVTAIGEVEVRM